MGTPLEVSALSIANANHGLSTGRPIASGRRPRDAPEDSRRCWPLSRCHVPQPSKNKTPTTVFYLSLFFGGRHSSGGRGIRMLSDAPQDAGRRSVASRCPAILLIMERNAFLCLEVFSEASGTLFKHSYFDPSRKSFSDARRDAPTMLIDSRR